MPWQTIFKWGFGIFSGLVLAFAIYAGIIRPTTKPNPTTTQAATTIVNHNSSPKATFGCTSVKVYEYYKDKDVK